MQSSGAAVASSLPADASWHLRGCDCPQQQLARETRGPFARPPHGPRSLSVMALEHVVHNIGELGLLHLQGLSDNSLEQLQMLLCSRGELSLDVWKMLTPFLAEPGRREDVRPGEWAFRVALKWQQDSLRAFVGPLSSPSLAFIAHLRLVIRQAKTQINTSELVALAGMPNLGMLEIVTVVEVVVAETTASTPIMVNDRLVRAWSMYSNAFPRLRLLRLWGCGDALTPACLPFVSRLTSLVVFDVCIGNYRRKGWRESNGMTAELGWRGFVSGYGLKRDCEEYRAWVTRMVLAAQGKAHLDSGGDDSDEDEAMDKWAKRNKKNLPDYDTLEWSAPFWLYDLLCDHASQEVYKDSPSKPAQPARLPMATLILDTEWLMWLFASVDARQLTFVRMRPPPPPSDSNTEPSTKRAAAENDRPRLKKTRKGVSAGEMLALLGG